MSERVRPLLGLLGGYGTYLVGGIEQADHAVKLRQLGLVPGDLPLEGSNPACDLGTLVAESGEGVFQAAGTSLMTPWVCCRSNGAGQVIKPRERGSSEIVLRCES